MRVIFAVVTGYLIFAVSAALWFQLSGQDPHTRPVLGFAIASVLWGMAFAGLGGYVAARGSQRNGLLASAMVGCLIAAGALLSMLLEGQHESLWSQLSAMLLMAPATCAGGLLNRRRQK